MKKIGVLALCAFIAACAAPIRPKVPLQGRFVKEDFNGVQLVQGGMVVGGFVAEPGKFDLQQSEELSRLLVKAFHWERPYLKPQPTAVLREALGDARYLEVMNQFAVGDVSPDMLTSIAAALSKTRYLAIARVEENADGGTATLRENTGESPFVRDKLYTLYTRHYRTMAVAMTIYDLNSLSVAFSGRLKDDLTYELDFKGGREPTTLVGWLVSGGPDRPETYAPPMPPIREILPHFFIAFGTNLPVLSCSDAPSGTEGCIESREVWVPH